MQISSDAAAKIYFPHHQEGIARLNNGSFGSCPATVLAAQAKWHNECIMQPDEFYFEKYGPVLAKTRTEVAARINCRNLEELVLIDNATTAAVIVAQDVSRGFWDGTFSKGDAVLMLDCTYGAVRKAFKHYVGQAGGSILDVCLPFPVSSEKEVVDAYARALESAANQAPPVKIRAALVEHITSMPSYVLPVKEIVSLLRDHGVSKIFVDAAHAVGNVHIDVDDIGADFYTSNLHKWAFAPATVALLCVKSQHLNQLHHPIISHFYNEGFQKECIWVGTRDVSAVLAVPAGFEFIDSVCGGMEAHMKYNMDRAWEMATMLSEAWGTIIGSPRLMSSSLVMVGVPPILNIQSEAGAMLLRTRLRNDFKVEVPMYVVPAEKSMLAGQQGGEMELSSVFVRLSHQIYNSLNDYMKLRDAVLALCKETEWQRKEGHMNGSIANSVSESNKITALFKT